MTPKNSEVDRRIALPPPKNSRVFGQTPGGVDPKQNDITELASVAILDRLGIASYR
jgi:hypothetical protein